MTLGPQTHYASPMNQYALLVFGFLFSTALQAVPPAWIKTAPLRANVGIVFSKELRKLIDDKDSSAWTFRIVSAPNWLDIEPYGEIYGLPSAKDLGNVLLDVEVTDDKVTWVPGTIQIEVLPQPTLKCTDGDDASLIGPTPDGKFKIYSCKENGPT